MELFSFRGAVKPQVERSPDHPPKDCRMQARYICSVTPHAVTPLKDTLARNLALA